MPDPVPYSSAPPTRPQGLDPRFGYTTGLLLLLIIACLTALTLAFHRRARLAEAHLAAAQARVTQLEGRPLAFIPMIAPDDLPRTPATLDGRSTEVLELDAITGQAVGLRPGDVLRVATEPPGQPASMPPDEPIDATGSTDP